MQNPLSEYNPEMEIFESEFEWTGEASGEVLGEGEIMELAAELLEAAERLFMAQGYAATSVDQIATAAGMSRRSFFRLRFRARACLARRLSPGFK